MSTGHLLRRRIRGSAILFSLVCILVFPLAGQSQDQPSSSPAASLVQHTDQTSVPTVKVSTRLVSLEVVARDKQGHPIPDLTAKDFEISEQIPPKREHHEQTVSVFRVVNWSDLRATNAKAPALPSGVYSNLVNKQMVALPPTVLLFDGINTELDAQLQVHQQMVKMLSSIPPDMPVAVFLLGNQLRLLQGFTTDPKLLREAAAKALVAGKTAPEEDPLDNPDTIAAKLEGTPGLTPGALASLEGFEQATFSFMLNVRAQKTMEALRGIARYLDGYPGRKNVLWISSSFPLMFWPADQSGGVTSADLRGFEGDMQEVGSALMDARIAIYPMDPGGVRTQSMFEASARMRNPASGQRLGQSIQREDVLRQGAQQTMRDLADETGGMVCAGDNNLGDCVKKAVDDANSYYELAYYPDSGDWHGEYHRITLKCARPGVHLSYREGYYARPASSSEGGVTTSGQQQDDPALRRAACDDPLNSTAVLLMVQQIKPDQAGAAKYFLAVDSRMLTFVQPEQGTHQLGISVAACTFDKTGAPLQYLQKNSTSKLNDQQYASAAHAVTQTFQFSPKTGVARVRLLVRDSASGRIGSVDVPFNEVTTPPTLLTEPGPGAKE